MVRVIILALLAIAAPQVARAEWKRAVSENFVVYSDGSEESLRSFTAKVEAFDSLMRVITNVRSPAVPKRVEIYLLRSQGALQRVLGAGSSNIAGIYRPRLEGAVALVPRVKGDKFSLDGETVLYHEYAHHFMMQYFPTAYPPWYVEGFAEFYSTAEVGEDGTASIGKPAYHRAYGLATIKPFPLAQLLSEDPKPKTAAEVDAYYGRAWLLTHMLAFSPQRGKQLTSYLDAFARGTPSLKAATEIFGPLPELEKDLEAYLKAKSMKYKGLKGLDHKTATIRIEALTPAQNAVLLDQVRFSMGISDKEKPAFLSDVRKAMAQFPDAPETLDMGAEALLLEEKTREAMALNDRLLALKPDFARALLRKAALMADQADDAKDPAAHWKAVRALIVKANRINNDDPVALYHYYLSYLRQGIQPPPSAIDGLFRAFELAGQAGEVRFALAQQLIGERKFKHARSLLQPIAYDPHNGEGAKAARDMIARIDKDEASAPKPPAKP
jgi:tetratricopeptide (TPR) repeat protein